MSTATFLQQWYDEVWNKSNESFIDQMMHRDVIVHGLDPSGSTKGIDSFKSFYKNFREAFPAIQIIVKHLVSNEEFATAYCAVTARNKEGIDVSFMGLSVIRVKDSKLAEGWNNFDFLKMYQQLGHILQAQIRD